jgi:cobalt/nickel transport system permease protein
MEIKKIILRSFLVLPFILAAFPLIFTIPGEPLLSFQFKNLNLNVSYTGLSRFAFILLKSWLSILISVILVMSTPFSEILKSLRWLRIPGLIVAVIGLMWRYLFVIVDEAKRLLIARSSRSGSVSGRKNGGKMIWRAKVSGGLAGNLFLRSIDRSDRVYNAMVSRGYDGDIKKMKNHNMVQIDLITMFGGLAFFTLVIVFIVI